MSQRTTWLGVLMVLGCWSAGAFHASGAASKSVTPLELGAAAPDFALPGVDGKTYRLADFAAAKVLVVMFTCNHCPTAQAYEQRIVQLHADYKDRGVALVAISPNDDQAIRLDELGYTDVSDLFDDMKILRERSRFQISLSLRRRNAENLTGLWSGGHTPGVYLPGP